MAKQEYVIGVDLGGTKIAAALCDDSCNVISKVKTDTGVRDGENVVIMRILDSIRKVIENAGITRGQVSCIGISSPGPLSISQGTILYAALLGWRNVPLRDIVQNEFKIPAYLENDANAAAYGEAVMGAGIGCSNIIYITVSTGIGSGLILNGAILHGKHDAAGELGHICIERNGRQCSCGNRGCLQAYASGTSIAEIAMERTAENMESRIYELSGGDLSTIDCLMVEKAAYEGDALAVDIWHNAGRCLGQGISIAMQMLDPDIVVIGGGVSKAWGLFADATAEAVRRNTYSLISEDMRIVPARLGENAGVIGAAAIALYEHGRNRKKAGIFFGNKYHNVMKLGV